MKRTFDTIYCTNYARRYFELYDRDTEKRLENWSVLNYFPERYQFLVRKSVGPEENRVRNLRQVSLAEETPLNFHNLRGAGNIHGKGASSFSPDFFGGTGEGEQFILQGDRVSFLRYLRDVGSQHPTPSAASLERATTPGSDDAFRVRAWP